MILISENLIGIQKYELFRKLFGVVLLKRNLLNLYRN